MALTTNDTARRMSEALRSLAKRERFKTFLWLRLGILARDTFNRVLAALKPKSFLEVFMAWTQK